MDEKKKTSLPNSQDFAEYLLDLEIGVEKSCNIETIRELVNLYSRAIEYYESVKDPKYKAYHNRLKHLLLQEHVQNVLNASAKSFSRKPLTSINLNKLTASESSSNLPEPEPHIQEERKSLKRSESDQNIAPGQIIRSQCLKNAEMQIQDSSIESQNSKKHALVNIRGQEEGIEDKIKARKSLRRNTLTHKSENTEKHENPFKHSEKFDKLDADKSAGRDRYQDGLVELMEKYLIEKMESVSVIRKKYQSQMEEILEMGNSPIIIEIVKQMEVSMNQEIQEFCAELEHKKLEEIARIRQVYIQ